VQNEENSDRYIIEIKCPYSARNCDSISQAYDIVRNFPLYKKINEKTQREEITLSKKHPYYYQIQTQLHCVKVERCDLVVYIPKEMIVLKIRRDEAFMIKVRDKLFSFHRECILPELVDQ